MQITEQCDGYGLNGIATTQFKVSVSAEEYAQKPPGQNAAVQFACEQLPMLLPKYYIINRVKKGNTVTFTCMDRMIFLDQTVNIAENQFTNDKADTWDVLETIRGQCGFSEVASLGMGGVTVSDILPKLKKEDVYMKSCRSILEVISKACAGFWRCGRQANFDPDSLIFHAFGSTPYAVLVDEVVHTAVSYGGEKGAIKGVIVTDGKDKTFSAGDTSDMFTTIQITTPYSSEAIFGNISQRVMGMTYKAWSCSKIKASTSGMITMGAQFNLGDDVTENGMWQYRWEAHINGVSGDVDISYCYKDFPGIIKAAGKNGYAKKAAKYNVTARISGVSADEADRLALLCKGENMTVIVCEEE